MVVTIDTGDDILVARTMRYGRCRDPQCGGVHFQFLDDDGALFAQFVLEASDVPAFLVEVKEAAEAVGSGGYETGGLVS